MASSPPPSATESHPSPSPYMSRSPCCSVGHWGADNNTPWGVEPNPTRLGLSIFAPLLDSFLHPQRNEHHHNLCTQASILSPPPPMDPPEPGGAGTATETDIFFDVLDVLPPLRDPDETFTTAPSPPPESETTSLRPSESPPALRRRRPSYKSSIPSTPSSDSSITTSKDPFLDQEQQQTSTTRSTSTAESRVEELDAAPPPPPPPTTRSTSTVESRVEELDAAPPPPPPPTTRSTSTVESRVEEPAAAPPPPPPPQSLLVTLAGFVIKALFFQASMLIKSFCFPIWMLYWSFLLVTDPFGALRGWRDSMMGVWAWVFKVLIDRIVPLVGGQGKLAARVAWGCFWAFYVSFVLLGLLVTAFFAGSLLMGRVVEEPVRLTSELRFDYTKASPDALVPLPPCEEGGCGLECRNQAGIWGTASWRPVPPGHKLQLTILLTLPESDYNQKLGVFQVRAEFLSAKGRITSSSSQPCMLRFKSSNIRFMESFLKTGTLLVGYSSESQVLRLKMTGFTEGTEPTVCVRVILEQRAEYRPGAGIPEIYAASLKLESELPFFKRIIWNWRRTVFIWISMTLFVWELFTVLICCRPLIIPRVRPSGSPSTG